MFVTPAMCKGLEREYLTYRFNQHTNYLTGFFRSPLLEPGRTEFIFRPTKATITAYDRARLELNERSRLAQQKAGIPENLQQLAFSQSFSQDFNENDYRYSTVQATRWMEELTGQPIHIWRVSAQLLDHVGTTSLDHALLCFFGTDPMHHDYQMFTAGFAPLYHLAHSMETAFNFSANDLFSTNYHQFDQWVFTLFHALALEMTKQPDQGEAAASDTLFLQPDRHFERWTLQDDFPTRADYWNLHGRVIMAMSLDADLAGEDPD